MKRQDLKPLLERAGFPQNIVDSIMAGKPVVIANAGGAVNITEELRDAGMLPPKPEPPKAYGLFQFCPPPPAREAFSPLAKARAAWRSRRMLDR